MKPPNHLYQLLSSVQNTINLLKEKSMFGKACIPLLIGRSQRHLATITSQSEQDFIVTNLPQVKAPVVQDGAGYWLGSFQPPGSSEQKTFVTDY
jgi:hypothetical protein